MSNFEADLLSRIQQLPPGTNPYRFIDDYLLESISPPRPKSFEIQLILCMVAHGICGILVLASLVVRIYRRSFWLVHFNDKNPKLWRPHFTAGWSIWAVILVVFLELAVYNANSSSQHLEPKFAYWWTFAWIPAWMGGFSAAWAITVSLLLTLYNSGKHNNLVEKVSPIVNVLSLVIPTAYLAIIIPIALRCSQYYEKAVEEVESIRRFLHVEAESFDARGSRFSLLDLAPVLPKANVLQEAFGNFQLWLRITFCYYACSAFLLVLLLGTVAALYVRFLRKALNEIGDSVTVREDGVVQRNMMEKTYVNLVITLVSFTTIGCIFSGLSLYIAIDPGALSSHTAAEAVSLVAFYTFALFGLPTSCLLFIHSFDQTNSHASTSLTPLPKPSGLFTRGRSHSHLPSLSIVFRRQSSSTDSKPFSPRTIELDDKFTSLPRSPPLRGFEIVLPRPSSKPTRIDSLANRKGEEALETKDLEYPPRPLPYYASHTYQRDSYSSSTKALNDSTSTRDSAITLSPPTRDSGIDQEIRACEREDVRDTGAVGTEGDQDRDNDSSQWAPSAFAYSPTERVNRERGSLSCF